MEISDARSAPRHHSERCSVRCSAQARLKQARLQEAAALQKYDPA
jgi:hypothetical protein